MLRPVPEIRDSGGQRGSARRYSRDGVTDSQVVLAGLENVADPDDSVMDFLEDVFEEEEDGGVLAECCAAVPAALGVGACAVSPDGTMVCPRSNGSRFCRLVMSSEVGARACREHFAQALERGGDAEIGICHAGLATMAVDLGRLGAIGLCGGRMDGHGDQHTPDEIAERLGLDPAETFDAWQMIPSYPQEAFRDTRRLIEAYVGHLHRNAEQLGEMRAEHEMDRTRLAHARGELESFKAQYEAVSREMYAKNEEQIRANLLLKAKIAENEEMFMGFLQALATAIDAKDPYTHNHSRRVTQLAVLTGREMGMPEEEVEKLEIAGFLHDIGKIGMPDSILKKSSRLTDEEFAIVKEHPAAGARMLASVRQLDEAARILKHHHERYDGTGYPDGLAGCEIPLAARVLAVADTFDAITTDRPYRKGATAAEAVQEMVRWSGTQFDPDAVRAFVRVEMYQLREKGMAAATQEGDAVDGDDALSACLQQASLLGSEQV